MEDLTSEECVRIERHFDMYKHPVFPNKTAIGNLAGNKFYVEGCIQHGAFSDSYFVRGGKKRYTMFAELIDAPYGHKVFSDVNLFYQSMRKKNLAEKRVQEHFLQVQGCFKDQSWQFLFFDNIGASVNSVRKYHVKGGEFPPADAMHLSMQVLNVCDYLQSLQYAHGDLSPDSFHFGLDNKEGTIYLIHFGRFRHFTKELGDKHHEKNRNRPIVPWHTRTPDFAPINAHFRKDYKAKEDLESWLYITANLFDSSMPPWKGKKVDDICEAKKSLFVEEDATINAFFKSTPIELKRMVKYIYTCPCSAGIEYDKIRQDLKFIEKRLGKKKKSWKGHWEDINKYPWPVEKRKEIKEKDIEKEKKRQKTVDKEKKKRGGKVKPEKEFVMPAETARKADSAISDDLTTATPYDELRTPAAERMYGNLISTSQHTTEIFKQRTAEEEEEEKKKKKKKKKNKKKKKEDSATETTEQSVEKKKKDKKKKKKKETTTEEEEEDDSKEPQSDADKPKKKKQKKKKGEKTETEKTEKSEEESEKSEKKTKNKNKKKAKKGKKKREDEEEADVDLDKESKEDNEEKEDKEEDRDGEEED